MSPSQNPTTRAKRTSRRPPRPTTAKGPRSGILLSLVLHGGLIAGTYLTWRNMVELSPESHAVPVDLIVAQQTNVRAEAPPPQKIDIPKDAIEPPALPAFAQAEPAPIAPLPQIKIKPDTAADSDEDKPTKKPTNKDFAALLNQLTATPKPQKNAKITDRTVKGIGNANLATADLADALKSQIYRCWSPPVGAPNAQDLVVDFDLKLNRNGTVGSLGMTPSTVARAATNTYTRAAADAASRAIYQCQGEGYKLPADRYDQWSEINPIRFDPRQMMGQ